MAGEAGLGGALLDDECDALGGEPRADVIPAVQPTQEGPGGDVGGDLPVEHRLYRAVGQIGYARDGDGVAFALLIGLRVRDPHLETLRTLGEVLDIERDEFGPRRSRGGAGRGRAADVDLIAAGIRPYPQLLARATGGPLSTLTPMFEDWWQRFVAVRRPEGERAALAAPLRTMPHLRHLLAALGESTALTQQVKALEARREQLQQELEAMTY